MLLVQSSPTCTDAGPDLLQLMLVVPFHVLHVSSILYIHVIWKLMECTYLCLLGTYILVCWVCLNLEWMLANALF